MTTATKPTWTRRPDPSRKTSAAALAEDPTDALIRNQAEKNNTELPAATPAAKGPVKHISLNMDGALHKRLKHYCVVHETNVSELLSDLAEKFLATAESV